MADESEEEDEWIGGNVTDTACSTAALFDYWTM